MTDTNVALTPSASKSTALLIAIVVLCLTAAAFVLALSWLRPTADNGPTILLLFGIVAPVVTALLATVVQAARNEIQKVHLAVNSRLTQLLELTARASKAEGNLEGVAAGAAAVGSSARAEGKADGVEQERARVVPS